MVNGLALRKGPEVRGKGFAPQPILLGSNLGQVVYSHCLPSLLSSNKLERFNGLSALETNV